jgi:hypothetical protein
VNELLGLFSFRRTGSTPLGPRQGLASGVRFNYRQKSPRSGTTADCPLRFSEIWSVEAIRFSLLSPCSGFSQFSRFPPIPPLLALIAGSFLASCGADGSGGKTLLMVDCRFQANSHVHMHVEEDLGTVALITRYAPGDPSSHLETLRKGIESKGRLASADGYRLVMDMYLLNDRLGESPGETVRIWVDDDGRSRIEARSPRGGVRTIDTGVCIVPEA